jgi:hypothetical protein
MDGTETGERDMLQRRAAHNRTGKRCDMGGIVQESFFWHGDPDVSSIVHLFRTLVSCNQ